MLAYRHKKTGKWLRYAVNHTHTGTHETLYWEDDINDASVNLMPGVIRRFRSDVDVVEVEVERKVTLVVTEDPQKVAAEEERRKAIVELAQETYHCEGSVEIDDDAKLSEGDDNGIYVQAWVWVDLDGTPFDKEGDDAGSDES